MTSPKKAAFLVLLATLAVSYSRADSGATEEDHNYKRAAVYSAASAAASSSSGTRAAEQARVPLVQRPARKSLVQ